MTPIKVIKCFVLTALVSTTSLVSASGIPTVDVANIAQMVLDAQAQALQAKAQLDAAMSQLDEAKRQFDQTKGFITGNSGYGGMYNDPAMTSYIPTSISPDSWEQLYTKMDTVTLQNMRNKYGLETDNKVQQEAYDKKLQDFYFTQGALAANNRRLENIQRLQEEADRATTPQQKQDIANRIAAEQAEIQNENNRLAVVNSLQAKQEKLQTQRVNQDFSQFLQGK